MLTPADYNYLKRNRRRFKQTADEAKGCLESAGLPVKDVFVRFQSTFGGYRPDSDVTHGIVDPAAKKDAEQRQDVHQGKVRVRCDLYNLTQVRHWLDEDGLFYYEDYAVAESFESYIRFTGYIARELEPLNWTHVDRERLATARYRNFMDGRKADTVAEASDEYHQIQRSEELFRIIRPHFDALYVRPDVLSGW